MIDTGPLVGTLGSLRVDGVGVRDWSVYLSEHRRMSLGIKDRHAGGVHAPLSVSEGAGASYLVVWDDGLVSRGSLERGDLAEPRTALSRARQAAYDDHDAARVMGPAEFPDVEIHSADAAAIAGGDTRPLERRLAAVRRRFDADRFRTWSGSFSASEARARIVTSAGLDASGSGTGAGWYVSFDGELGDGFSARAPEDHGRFERRLERLSRTVRALAVQGTVPASGERPVLIHPGVVERYVLGVLWHNLDGSTVADDEGRFRRDDFGSGAPVLREDLALRLDPLQPMRNGSYRFTSQGVPAARCTYVERGRLVNPTLDLKYASRLDRDPTPLPFSSDAVTFEAGRILTFDEGVRAADGGALILSVLGIHTQDFASGDFSLSAPQALVLRDGGYAGRMRGTISGNLWELLRSERTELVAFDDEHVPGLLVRCRLDPQ